MLIEEARWINDVLEKAGPEPGWMVLDIGSSTEYFRRVDQPYIDYYVFRPLRKAGATIVHVDSRQGEGIDLIADLADPGSQGQVDNLPKADIVLCCNMLEHVVDRQMVAGRLSQLPRPGGLLVVTVPHVYRYHEDPIDTMYRPTNKELERLFAGRGFRAVHSILLDVECGYVTVPRGLPRYLAYRIRNSVRYWVFKKHPEPERCKVAAVVLRKVES